MYTIGHLHFRVRAEKVDQKKKFICGRKCLPASDLKSSIHLAYHKKNGEMLWPWWIKIPSWGKRFLKELFYPARKAKPDTRTGSWRQIQIRKKNHIFTPWFHYPSEMADLHSLMPSRMDAFLDKHSTGAVGWVWWTRYSSTVSPELLLGTQALPACLWLCAQKRDLQPITGITNITPFP